MDVDSYWGKIRFAKTEIKKELVKRLQQAIESEIRRERLYEDPRWREKRLEILERDNHKCQICGCDAQDVHHIKYINSYNAPWNIENDYLVSLCKECHSKFDGTSSDDYVFIPASHPILLRGYSDEECQSYSNEVLGLPKWHEVKPLLEDFGRYENNHPLILAIYYPLSSRMWKKRVLNSFNGFDELDDYIGHIRYSPDGFERAIEYFDSRKKWQPPFLSKSLDFINGELKKYYGQSKLIPREGLFVLAVRNKKKGYYIKLINIAEKRVVKYIDFSNNDDYKGVSIAEQCRIGILYAFDFLRSKCMEGDLDYSYKTPIFSVWEPNLVCPYHYKKLYLSYMNKTHLSSSIDELKLNLLKKIGPDYQYNIFQWTKKLWGNEPIYNE